MYLHGLRHQYRRPTLWMHATYASSGIMNLTRRVPGVIDVLCFALKEKSDEANGTKRLNLCAMKTSWLWLAPLIKNTRLHYRPNHPQHCSLVRAFFRKCRYEYAPTCEFKNMGFRAEFRTVRNTRVCRLHGLCIQESTSTGRLPIASSRQTELTRKTNLARIKARR